MLAFLLLLPLAQALFFGSGSSSCGCSAPPPCPPPPVCAPPPAPVCPPAPDCGQSYASAPTGYASAPISYAPPPQPFYTNQIVEPQPQIVQPVNAYPTGKHKVYAHGVKGLKNVKAQDDYLRETEGYRRLRRDTEAAFDPKCNSEALKDIILKNIADSTANSKRRIQEAATDELGGRIDVICSSGTFSYIVNTELYCETEKNGITCFAFRQAS